MIEETPEPNDDISSSALEKLRHEENAQFQLYILQKTLLYFTETESCLLNDFMGFFRELFNALIESYGADTIGALMDSHCTQSVRIASIVHYYFMLLSEEENILENPDEPDSQRPPTP